MSINSVIGGADSDGNYIFEIDYSDENGFGGSGREQIYISVVKEATGFGERRYGDSFFYGEANQKYTKQFFYGVRAAEYNVEWCLKYKDSIYDYALEN